MAKLIDSIGEPAARTYIRSAAKPFQIMPFLNDGLDEHFGLTDTEVAVIMASHNGEAVHIEAVQSILKKVGLSPEALKCAFHPPMHPSSAQEHALKNAPASPIYNNCSGKHSGMLALARFHNWPLDHYLDPEHPVQKRILEVISDFSGLPGTQIGVGVDGCSAPVFFLPIQNMAFMYAKLAEGKIAPTERICDLMAAHPEMIAGRDRFDTDVMRVMAGRVVSKVGAEGIRCIGIRGERPLGIALKIEDGSKRASEAVIMEVLVQLDLIATSELKQLAKYRRPVMVNHAGIETGWIEPNFQLPTL